MNFGNEDMKMVSYIPDFSSSELADTRDKRRKCKHKRLQKFRNEWMKSVDFKNWLTPCTSFAWADGEMRV